MKNKSLIKEVKHFQKIAGILKENYADYESESGDTSVKVIKFKKNNQDLGMFLNWLESNYTEAQASDTDTWDTDESFYFDPTTLTLVLYNEEFDMEGNQEFHDYLQDLKSNIRSIKESGKMEEWEEGDEIEDEEEPYENDMDNLDTSLPK